MSNTMVELNEKALEQDRARLIHILVVHFDMFRDKAEEAADLFLHDKTLVAPDDGLVERLRNHADAAAKTLSSNSMMPTEMSGLGDLEAETLIDLCREAATALSAGVRVPDASCVTCHGTGDHCGNPDFGQCDDCGGTGLSALSDAPVVKEDDVAATLWRTEVIDAGVPPSVIARRTRDAFENESDSTKDKWRKYAKAAIAALGGGK